LRPPQQNVGGDVSPVPPIIAAPAKVMGSPPNTWCIWPTLVHVPNDISITAAVLAQLTVATNRQTDRQTQAEGPDHAASETAARRHLCRGCVRCVLKITSN